MKDTLWKENHFQDNIPDADSIQVDDIQTRAEKLRQQANAAVGAKKYAQACELYTQAIELSPCAILYANRALARTKMEEYGYAYMDACKSIELDCHYPKGYYRRAVANFALGKYKAALEDFKKECERRIREQAFAKAIDSDAVKPVSLFETIDYESIIVEDSYQGPTWEQEDISESFCYELIEYLRNQGKLHKKYLIKLLVYAKRYLDQLDNIVSYQVKESGITVCGDTHGQYYDLLNIFQLNGYPSRDNPYLFNGDFVDRGSFSVEVIITLLTFVCYDPLCMLLNRGNHESKNMNKIYGFEGEVKTKYNETIYSLFAELFESLPLGHLLIGNEKGNRKQVLVIHGGLFSRDGVLLEDLQHLDRHREPDQGLMAELLWSDPQKEMGWGVSKRGIGVSFGPDVTCRFLDANQIALLVRSHEMKEQGYEVEADNRLITVFSAPNYCDQMGNLGAYIRFSSTLEPQFYTFAQVPHPNVPPMAYASNGLGSMGLV
ncbi:protein phosphatase [Galdieria sulphuraria]|uniref:Serine/threonine-protein phosphatase n=1 Tax=Galdieria sulphuraria TaxID=130081 RepID=M2WWK5_GALSU|nr:protein phosphatase [Galdieria sulphuraria]EME28390.1 protein phosphatase [Galdieria sulphuraria]|eukprot:XP_005704910.1 protein phosphatase [Galdieria sulphuraria]